MDNPVVAPTTARRIIHADGRIEFLHKPMTINKVHGMLQATVVNNRTLRDKLLMFFDDQAGEKKLPINHIATLIHASAHPFGIEFQLRGDVIVVPEADFEMEAVHG